MTLTFSSSFSGCQSNTFSTVFTFFFLFLLPISYNSASQPSFYGKTEDVIVGGGSNVDDSDDDDDDDDDEDDDDEEDNNDDDYQRFEDFFIFSAMFML